MKELYHLYGDRVRFVEVLVRQAHPGERHGAYSSYAEKRDEARLYQQEEAIPWSVVIDDLGGTVQRAYGGMSAPSYLVDAEGRVAFYSMWGHAPAIRQAIDALLSRGSRGALDGGGIDRALHLAAAIVAGRRGPARGGMWSLVDLELGFPGAFILMTFGSLARPMLAPRVLRTTPLPRAARVTLLAGLVSGVAGLFWAIRSRR